MRQDGKGREVTGTQGPRTTPRQLQSGPHPAGHPLRGPHLTRSKAEPPPRYSMMIHSFVLWYQRSARQHGAADKHGTPTHAPTGVTQPGRPPGTGCGSPSWLPSHHAPAADTLQTDQVPGQQPSPLPQSPPGKGSRLRLWGAQSSPSRHTLAQAAGAARPLQSRPTPETLLTPCPPKGSPSGRGQAPLCMHAWPWGLSLLGGPSPL